MNTFEMGLVHQSIVVDGAYMVRVWETHYPRGPRVEHQTGEVFGEAAEQLWARHYPRAKRRREQRRRWMRIAEHISMMGTGRLADFAKRYNCCDCEWLWLVCLHGRDITLRAHDWTYSERIDSWDGIGSGILAMTIDELRERI